MKNKPTKHKTENRFRFKSFNEQLANVNISYARHELNNRHLFEDTEETKFLQTLYKWDELNCTQDFMELKSKIGSYSTVTTLAQIVHRRDHLINALTDCLRNPENKAIDVSLELMVALTFDLRNEFYPYFFDIFDVLVGLLHSQDPTLLENLFVCFAYMFKSLWRYILNDFHKLLVTFSHRLLISDQKEHIKLFAAQSFSFLMRKIEDKDSLLELLFEQLEKQRGLCHGYGLLLFETVSGVNHQLHSCSTHFINLLLKKYTNEHWANSEVITSAVNYCFDSLSKFVVKDTSDVIWKSLCDSLSITNNSKAIENVGNILFMFIEFKECALVNDPDNLLMVLSKVLNVMKDEDCVNILLKCASTLVLKLHSTMSLKLINSFMKIVFSALSLQASSEFVSSLFSYVFLERDVLPNFLPYLIDRIDFSSSIGLLESLQIIVDLLLYKRSKSVIGHNLNAKRYILHFPEQKQTLRNSLLSSIRNYDCSPLMLCSIICLPHVKPSDDSDCCVEIASAAKKLIDELTTSIDEEEKRVKGLLLLESIYSTIVLSNESIFDSIPCSSFTQLVKSNPVNVVILQSFDYYLEFAKRLGRKEVFDLKHFESIYELIQTNFSSPLKCVRLLTLHISSLFNPPLPPSDSAESCQESIFAVCLTAEMLPISVQEYREKLRLLHKLEYGIASQIIPIEAVSGYSYEKMPMSYLFGTLYSNLSLLWTPINNIIETYARGLKNFETFWNILLSHYAETMNYIKCQRSNDVDELNFDDPCMKKIAESLVYVDELNDSRPDHYNHRIQIIHLLQSIADVIEKKNRDFVKLFLSFMEEEASSLNLKRDNVTEDISLSNCSDDSETNESNSNSKAIWRTLIAFLEVFSKFRNPKALYKEPELRYIFNYLLQHKDYALQKATLDCLLAYDFPFLSPYKENLLRLIDNKTFKSEIVNFNINATGEDIIVKDDHREEFMPYLMRIVYGKMLFKTGEHTAGHSKSTLRRSIVFRFLAGCSEKELKVFLSLAFSSFVNFLSHEFKDIFDELRNINLQTCIPIRRALSSLKTLELMLINIGNISRRLLPHFFKLLIVISYFATTLLQRRGDIKEIYVSKLKFLRSECLKLSAKFFQMFCEYNYTPSEIDAFFESNVWPLLPKLQSESLTAPSPLLKLIETWSENSRYFVLLMKTDKSKQIYPLSVTMALYKEPKCHVSVIDLISGIIVNLLTFHTYNPMEVEGEETVTVLEINDVQECESIDNEIIVNYGTSILMPFVNNIISRLKINFDNRCESQVKKSVMTPDELTILTRIAPYIHDENQCKLMANFFIGTLNNKPKRSEDADSRMLETIDSLLKQTTALEEKFVTQFTPLFRSMKDRTPRLQLCIILSTMASIDDRFTLVSKVTSMINSYNPRNPEEPDYAVRMDGFKLLKENLDSMLNDTDLLSVIVYNCCSFIAFIDDMGIREASSDAILSIVEKITSSDNTSNFMKICIEILFFKEIRNGIRQKSENVRHEFIGILRTLIKVGHENHSLLSQLKNLYDDDDDLDFFFTIRHIQLHRRSRALMRLSRNTEVLEILSSKLLSSYILPIATGFLFDQRYQKNSTLIASAIDAVGNICRYIDWPVYNKLLKYYLNLLSKDFENHKIIVKVLSAILNNFNYDLSNVENGSEIKDQKLEETEETSNKRKKRKLNSNVATKIHDYIVNQLLPNLHKVLHTSSRADYEYDSMRNAYPEDNEIQKVPLAFAIVSLLKTLPNKSNLESNVPSVFLRLLNFLKSKSESIRETSRSALIKVMHCLGPQYFPYLLREMQAMLKKGYQVHILTYTLHSLVDSLKPQLKSGDFDVCVGNMIDICVQEIFSDVAEEKEVGKIVAKVKEARKIKSFETFQIIANFASEQSLAQIIYPLKKLLLETHKHKVLRNISKCIQKVAIGLTENSSLSEATLLTFFYGIVHDSIPDLQLSKKPKQKAKSKLRSEDHFIIKRENIRKEVKPKTNIDANHFILIQESLRIICILLKKDRLKPSNAEHFALLNPFVPILSEYVASQHPKLTVAALKCIISIIVKFPNLSSFTVHANKIKNNLFVLLHKHTGVGMQQSENYDVVVFAFKTMHYLISEVDCVELDEKQLEVLLLYAEKDILENSRQAVAFAVLKAIVGRRLDSPELKSIMTKLSEMLVQSEHDYVRKQCVQIWMRYLIDYPHGKNLKSHLMFFTRQLQYEHESGRMSVLEFLLCVVSRFPDAVLNSYRELIFIPVASRLINEESSKARKSAAEVLTKLFQRLDLDKRNSLFDDIILPWFQQTNLLMQQLGARLCLLLSEVEDSQFSKRINRCITLLSQKLNHAKDETDESDIDDVNLQMQNDHLYYHLLLLFFRILKLNPKLVKGSECAEDVSIILESIISKYLLYPHVWIRIVSVEIWDFVFSLYSVEEIIKAMVECQDNDGYLLRDTEDILWKLTLKFLDILHDVYDSEKLGENLIKNILFVGKVLCGLPESWGSGERRKHKLNIKWLINRLLYEMRIEVSENGQKVIEKRMLIFKWIAAIVLELDKSSVLTYLETLLKPLCRELSDKSQMSKESPQNLHILAEDVMKVVQRVVGNEAFGNAYGKVISDLSRQRLRKKHQRAIELVVNPLKGLKRKHKKHVSLRENKKRKLAEKCGKTAKKSRK